MNVHSHYHDWETIDEVRQRAHRWGVCRYVMSALGAPGGVPGNEVMERMLADHGDFIVALFHLDPDAHPVDAVYRAKEAGFGGVKIIGTLKPYDAEAYYPFYDAVEKTGLPVLFHTGFLSISPSQRRRTVSMMNMRPGMLDTLGRAFPDMKMIGAHLGSPWFLEAMATANFHKNVYFDVSGGAVRANSLPFFRRLFAFRDASTADVKDMPLPPDDDAPNMELVRKLMFGTDNPPPERIVPFAVKLLDGLGADAETRARFWYRNAAEVFSLDI
ncbi:MAG TPA: hypothetical protein ENN09_07635 [Planctomycetes bacterium]|nr:hypothetical protein [Planctomycetota bacterium]